MAAVAGLLAKMLSDPGSSRLGSAFDLPELQDLSSVGLLKIGLAAALVKAAAGSVLALSQSSLASRVGHRLRIGAVDSLLAAGADSPTPRVAAVLRTRLLDVETGVRDGVIAASRAVAQLAALALCLIVMSPFLAVSACTIVGGFGWLLGRVRSRLKRAGEQSQGLAESLALGEHELLANLDLWRSYGAGPRVRHAIADLGRRAGRAAASVAASRAALSGANEVLGVLALLGAVALAAESGPPIADGRLVAFVAVSFMAYRPLRDLGEARGNVLRGSLAIDALRRLDCQPGTRARTAESGPVRNAWGDAPAVLRLAALGAKHRGPRTSAILAPGATVCLRGVTGSGKTTLLRCLLGLEPATGRVTYGDHDLTDAGVGPHARPFAWVPQDAPLVTGTVVENVALGGDEAHARIALTRIGAQALLRDDGLVGPGGRALSGGEQRQVALARAVASGAPVLLLDEPTAGLDAAAREHVLGAIRSLRGRRTVIIATHRDEVAALADQVVAIGAAPEPPLAAVTA